MLSAPQASSPHPCVSCGICTTRPCAPKCLCLLHFGDTSVATLIQSNHVWSHEPLPQRRIPPEPELVDPFIYPTSFSPKCWLSTGLAICTLLRPRRLPESLLFRRPFPPPEGSGRSHLLGAVKKPNASKEATWCFSTRHLWHRKQSLRIPTARQCATPVTQPLLMLVCADGRSRAPRLSWRDQGVKVRGLPGGLCAPCGETASWGLEALRTWEEECTCGTGTQVGRRKCTEGFLPKKAICAVACLHSSGEKHHPDSPLRVSSSGFLCSSSVSAASQSRVSSLAAHPQGGPLVLSGGQVDTSASVVVWAYLTVKQLEDLELLLL